ncbi:MAG: GTPase Era [Bacteroidia bacterium]
MHKSGFVNIIGKPNVGKSTLMNKLIKQDLSIVTHKAQTTRHRIKGIVSTDEYQIVFSDTPGILKPAYKLHAKMMETIDHSFTDADLVILVVEVGEKKTDEEVLKKIKKLNVPLFLVINKIDLSDQEKLEMIYEFWKTALPSVTEIIPISALENFNMDVLLNKIVACLPEGPAYFAKDEMSDRNERFFVTEIIREKILLNYKKEIPYSTEVAITDFKDSKDIARIYATIYVLRESQKAIILGHKGEAIKRTGTQSRKKIEALLGKKVHLDLTIKISDNWREDENQLKRFGYGN